MTSHFDWLNENSEFVFRETCGDQLIHSTSCFVEPGFEKMPETDKKFLKIQNKKEFLKSITMEDVINHQKGLIQLL